MPITDPTFVPFLLRAKRATYAAGDAAVEVLPSRPSSHDLSFAEGNYTYIDTYLGGFAFLGEEAVWEGGQPIWGMNYYGFMEEGIAPETIPAGFGDFLKHALRDVPADAPFRGPAEYSEGHFRYMCRWNGSLARFGGEETILYNSIPIYHLYFHGGTVI